MIRYQYVTHIDTIASVFNLIFELIINSMGISQLIISLKKEKNLFDL